MNKNEFTGPDCRKQKTALITAFVFLLLDLIFNIICIAIRGFSIHLLTSLIPLITISLYAVRGYLKPHGVNIKIMFLVKAVCIGLSACSSTYVYSFTAAMLICIVAATAYMAGRLNKIRKNARIMFVVSIIFLIIMVLHTFVFKDAMMLEDAFNHFLQWIALACVYFGRYKEHRTAGIEYDIKNFGPEFQALLKDFWIMLKEEDKEEEQE